VTLIAHPDILRSRVVPAVAMLVTATLAALPDARVDAAGPQDVANDNASPPEADSAEATAGESASRENQTEPLLPFHQRPYRVDVSVSFAGTGRNRDLDPRHVLDRIRQSVERMYGRMWNANFRESDWPRPGTRAQLARIDIPDLIDDTDPEQPVYRWSEQDVDKAMFVSVESNAAGFVVACREYDTRSQELTPVRQAETPEARAIPLLAARLIRDSFRPCLMYVRRFMNDSQEEFIELQVQAGEIPALDPSAEQIREGDVLKPFLRYMHRRDPSKLRKLQPLPLTYVRVVSVDRSVTRGMTTGVLLSHAAVAAFGRRGRHLQHFALRQRPAADSSQVRLVQRSREMRPLVCQRISVVFKLRSSDTDQAEPLKLLSNRNGEVTIPVSDEYSTLWLYVYSGRLLLARVPFAPGLLPSDTIELPNDSIRLSVEGDLQLLSDELISAVAMREVHFSLARRAADEGRADELDQHLADYLATPRLTEFREALSLIRIAALRRTQVQNNRRAGLAVEKLCRSMNDSLGLFFSEEKRVDRLEQMDDLRQKVRLQ